MECNEKRDSFHCRATEEIFNDRTCTCSYDAFNNFLENILIIPRQIWRDVVLSSLMRLFFWNNIFISIDEI